VQPCNFADPVEFAADLSGYGIAAADMDGDGDIDLVTDSNTGAPNDALRVHWNDGSGAFPTWTETTAGDGPGNIALGDYDNDGDIDIFHANYFSHNVHMIPNNGDGTFGASTAYAMGGGCDAVALGDIDGDGDLDMVGTDHFGGRVRSWLNDGTGGFVSLGLFAADADPNDLALDDLDNDGDLDALVSNEDSSSVTALFNDGDGAFPTRVSLPVGERPTGVAIVDLNDDGINDIVSADWGALSPINNTISVMMGTGGGAFSAARRVVVHGRPGTVQAADLNGDGVLDLVVSCEADDAVAILTGVGDGTFLDHQLFVTGVEPRRLALADFDGDGDTDIATLGVVLENITGTPIDLSQLDVSWNVNYDNLFNVDLPSHISTAPDGGVVSAGTTYFSANEDDYLIIKHDPDGAFQWEYTYNGTGDHYDKVQDLHVDPLGNIYVCGRSYGPNFGIQWLITKLDADGNELWVERYDAGNPGAQQNALALSVASDGRVAVTGWARNADFVVGFMTASWDPNGNFLWDQELPSLSGFAGQGSDVAHDSMGNVYVTGEAPPIGPGGSGSEILTAKLAAADGSVVWTRRFDGSDDPSFNASNGRGIFVTSGDDIIVAASGYNFASTGRDFLILKYDSDGNLVWDTSIQQAGSEFPDAIFERKDGSLLVSGGASLDVQVAALDAAGSILWTQIVEGSTRSDNPKGHIAVSGIGTISVLGSLGTDIAVHKLDRDGNPLSSARVDSGNASDYPAAIAQGDAETLFVLGQYQGSILNRTDFAIFRIEPIGQRCSVNLNGDGSLDVFDVFSFLDAFEALDPVADFTGDGLHDVFDVFAFLDAYSAGCL
jgi:hypothetical protein